MISECAKVTEQERGLSEIRHALQLDIAREHIIRQFNNLTSSLTKGGLFGKNGLCASYPVKPLPNNYFIAQEFYKNDTSLRRSLENALKQLGMYSIRADEKLRTAPLVCTASALIQGTPFGIYQLSESKNRNVYLELGIAIGLRRPFILVKDLNAEVAELIKELNFYQINSFLETELELPSMINKYITEIVIYSSREILSFKEQNFGVLAHGNLESLDISVPIIREFKKHKLNIIILSKPDENLSKYLNYYNLSHKYAETKEEMIAAIRFAKIGVYRKDKSSDPNAFITLGIAIGLNKPVLLINNKREDVPADLQGLVRLEFHGLMDLESQLKTKLPDKLVSLGSVKK